MKHSYIIEGELYMPDPIKLNLFDAILDSCGMDGLLENKVVTFNGKTYPKYGHAVTVTGGPGSGKTYMSNTSIPIDAKTMNIDDIKEIYVKLLKRKLATLTNEADKEELLRPFGGHIPDFKNPKDNSVMHEFITDKAYFKKLQEQFFNSNMGKLPNILLDITGGNFTKLQEYQSFLKGLGYYTSIIWVITDIEIAKQQNKNRDRTVDEEFLINAFSNTKDSMWKAAHLPLVNTDEFWILFTHQKQRNDTAIPLKKQSDGSFDIPEDLKLRIERQLNMHNAIMHPKPSYDRLNYEFNE
jgi:dephospho-CoA kinase